MLCNCKDASNNTFPPFTSLIHPDDEDFIHVMDSMLLLISYVVSATLNISLILTCFQSNCSALNPGGYILLEVPNSNYIRENGLLSEVIPDHLHYFSVNSMLALSLPSPLNIVSFESIWSDGILSFLFHKPEGAVSTIDRFSLSHNSLIQQIEEQLSALLPLKK